MKAIILAAGKGTRLLPLTEHTPKPLIEVAGTPIINRIFQSLPDKIDEVIIIIEHLKEKIKNHVGDKSFGRNVTYVNQGEKKGTFGALVSAQHLFSENERFLVLNGDDLHEKEELQKYLDHPRSLGVQYMNMPNYYSVHLGKDNLIEGFSPQTEEEKKGQVLIATGVYLIDSNIFKHPGIIVHGGEYGLPQTILAQKEEYPITGVITSGWIPINSFEDIEKAEKILTK
jgi:NDP-sugar pyrophosphorylase family protein